MKIFKKVTGDSITDIVKHTLTVLNEHPYAEIHIGTDSQNCGMYTHYSTVIAYKFATRGVHYIFNNQKVPKINDQWTRLWKEAELSIETAKWLSERIASIKVNIDMDYNCDENYFSSKLVSAAGGWAGSLGFNVNIKPNNQIATKAADQHCR